MPPPREIKDDRARNKELEAKLKEKEKELKRLEKQLADERETVEILKKSLHIFMRPHE